jgi:hypothetical protein
LATVGCGLLLAGGGAVTNAAQAAPISCDRVNQNQHVTLVGTVHEYAYSESYSSGGRPSRYAERRTSWDIGSVTIGVATCHRPGGSATSWQLISPAVVTPKYDGLVVSKGSFQIDGFRSRAWATTADRVNATSISTRADICERGFVWAPIGAVLSLPLPVPFVASVGQWVATKVLPSDRVHCSGLGSFQQPVTFTVSGAPRVATGSTTFVWSASVNGPYKGVKEWTVTIHQA